MNGWQWFGWSEMMRGREERVRGERNYFGFQMVLGFNSRIYSVWENFKKKIDFKSQVVISIKSHFGLMM